MSVSHKYRKFDELLESVKIDFNTYNLEGMIEPQQLIKVATRVNYDLGLKIHRWYDAIIDVENNKGKLPNDFYVLNFGAICGNYTVNVTPPSGTHVDTTQPKYVPSPGYTGPCDDPECKDVCVVKTCDDTEEYTLIQYIGPAKFREYTVFLPLRIANTTGIVCDCPNINAQSADIAEIKDGYLLTNFASGKVYISYQGALENRSGELLVLDHPYCNEYYEYALKQRILENMVMAGENVVNQLGLMEGRLRGARNNALTFVNTPDFADMRKIWDLNRKAQYHNYYNMFKSVPTNY